MGKVVVDQGALRMALNVLIRAGKTEVAEALETSATDYPELPSDGCYIVRFDDAERPDVDFNGYGARDAALKYYDHIAWNWNGHLYAKIDSNTRDAEARFPSLKVADIHRFGRANPSQDEATTCR